MADACCAAIFSYPSPEERKCFPMKERYLETGKIVTTGTGKELLTSPEIKKAYLGG